MELLAVDQTDLTISDQGRSCGLICKCIERNQVPDESTHIDCGQSRLSCGGDDKGQIGSVMKSFKFLLFMNLHKSNGLIKDQ